MAADPHGDSSFSDGPTGMGRGEDAFQTARPPAPATLMQVPQKPVATTREVYDVTAMPPKPKKRSSWF